MSVGGSGGAAVAVLSSFFISGEALAASFMVV